VFAICSEDASEENLDDIALGIPLGIDLAWVLGVVSQLVVGVELSDLLASTASVHQVDEVDVDLLQRLWRSSVSAYTITWLTDVYLLALGDGTEGLETKLSTEVLETLELIGDTESSEVAFELLIVAGSSLTGSLLLVPFLLARRLRTLQRGWWSNSGKPSK
jgi:hypothetical protein